MPDGYQAGLANHAQLFALLAQAALAYPAGEAALEQGIIRYARQRGQRMALRASQDGLPHSVASYLLYGEWQAAPALAEMRLPAYSPEVHLQNRVCPWYNHWQAHGQLALGRYYCASVDAHLAQGFAPDLRLETVRTHHTANCCDFFFRGQAMDGKEQEKLARNRQKLGRRAIMPWNYHAGHLYQALLTAFAEYLGQETANQIGGQVLAVYAAEYGAAAAEQLAADYQLDYSTPAYPGTPGLEA